MQDWWNTKGWKHLRNMGIAAASAVLGYIETAGLGGEFGTWGPIVMAINGYVLANLIPKIGLD